MDTQSYEMFGLGWIPVIFFTVTISAYITPYLIAIQEGHVYFLLPAISDSGVLPPESLVFRELMNLSGFLAIACCFVRFMQFRLIRNALECHGQYFESLRPLNQTATFAGLTGGLAVTFVGNFQAKTVQPFSFISEYSIHNVAAILVFFLGVFYCWVQLIISRRMLRYGVSTKEMCLVRFMLSSLAVIAFIVFIISSIASTKIYNFVKSSYIREPSLQWRPEDPAYVLHVVSNFAEWMMCGSLAAFPLTFINEFKRVKIVSDFACPRDAEELISNSEELTIDRYELDDASR